MEGEINKGSHLGHSDYQLVEFVWDKMSEEESDKIMSLALKDATISKTISLI